MTNRDFNASHYARVTEVKASSLGAGVRVTLSLANGGSLVIWTEAATAPRIEEEFELVLRPWREVV